jgi:hypothetical protein
MNSGKLIVVSILTLAAMAGAQPVTETDYLAILLEGKKIGYAENTRIVEGATVRTLQHQSMTLGRGGQAVKIDSSETHIETLDGKPLGFEMLLNMSGIEEKRTGTVADGKVTIVVEAVGARQEMTLDWPAGAMLNEGMRLLQEQKGLTEGLVYEADIFRPDMKAAIKAKIAVGKKTPVDLFGRVVELTEVKVTMLVSGQAITATTFVDAELKALKTLVPMMGMTMEMVQCDKAFAMRDDDVVDFLDRLSVKSPSEMTDIAGKASIQYELTATCEGGLTIPATSSQTVKRDNGRVIVAVQPNVPKADTPLPYAGDNAEALAAMKPNDYLQSDDAKVKELAATVVGTTTETLKAARQIESFVNGYIITKDLSVGYASAAEVAKSRQGDCSEHAVLTAAMCRAAGIPARVVCGVVYVDTFIGQKSVFGGHMWTEVFVGDSWVGLDATRAPNGFGPGHIALAIGDGNPSDFFSLVNTLGCFKVDKITATAKPGK